MSPLEAAIRAAASVMGVGEHLDWKDFEEVGRAALEGLLNALPADLAEAVRRHVVD